MTARETIEMAALLIREHGDDALRIAEQRRDQFAREPHSDAYRSWSRVAAMTARLLRARQPA